MPREQEEGKITAQQLREVLAEISLSPWSEMQLVTFIETLQEKKKSQFKAFLTTSSNSLNITALGTFKFNKMYNRSKLNLQSLKEKFMPPSRLALCNP